MELLGELAHLRGAAPPSNAAASPALLTYARISGAFTVPAAIAIAVAGFRSALAGTAGVGAVPTLDRPPPSAVIAMDPSRRGPAHRAHRAVLP